MSVSGEITLEVIFCRIQREDGPCSLVISTWPPTRAADFQCLFSDQTMCETKSSQACREVWGWTRQNSQPSHIADLLGKAEEKRAGRA